MKSVIIIITILNLCMGATTSTPKEQPPIWEYSYVSVDSFLRFINADPVLINDNNLKLLTSVDISKKWDSAGNIIYLAKVISEFMWGCSLYMISTDGNEITDIVDTGLGGNSYFFSYEVVSISQGDFISAYCASHMGNGNLELVSISQLGTVKYVIPFAIDGNYEDMRLTAIEYGLISGEDENLTASAIYLGGKLHADYVDLNQDGNTDITLTGIQQIYETGINFQEQILRKEYYIKNIYLYDQIIDAFIFNGALSEKTLVNDYY